MRVLGIGVMLFVAFNDATLAVLARKMKELHFSIMMFWFSAIGLMFILAYLIGVYILTKDYPAFFYYNQDQYKNLTLTGIFSALNLTCLVIAYQNDKSVTVSLMAYIELVYVIVADLLIFDQKFVPMEIVGASIITFFNIITICYKMKYTTQRGPVNDLDLID